jgi:hypothetical protein
MYRAARRGAIRAGRPVELRRSPTRSPDTLKGEIQMRIILVSTALAALSMTAACSTIAGAGVGAAAGAAIGNNTGDGDAKKGAVIGGAAGAVVGTVAGN